MEVNISSETKDRLLWLHVKKSAGLSTRKMLAPLYLEVDRVNQPSCFIQAKKEEYNDILNNYRVVLGEYQFRRCLFAKKFLFPTDFDRYLRVAFSRNPFDRCVSQFFYLWHKPGWRRSVSLHLAIVKRLRFRGSLDYDFGRFITAIEECRDSPSNIIPYGLHFQTHTAAMWDDIVDDKQRSLLDLVFRLEDLEAGVNQIRTTLGHDPLPDGQQTHLNETRKVEFTLSHAHRKRIETLFGKDFDIYEGMCEIVD